MDFAKKTLIISYRKAKSAYCYLILKLTTGWHDIFFPFHFYAFPTSPGLLPFHSSLTSEVKYLLYQSVKKRLRVVAQGRKIDQWEAFSSPVN